MPPGFNPTRADLLRHFVVSHAAPRRYLRRLALVMPAIAVVCALKGLVYVIALGAVCMLGALWLTGDWVIPGSTDAYIRALLRAWKNWATKTAERYDLLRRQDEAVFRDLQRLCPPAQLMAEHDSLMRIIDERVRLMNQTRRSPADALRYSELASTLEAQVALLLEKRNMDAFAELPYWRALENISVARKDALTLFAADDDLSDAVAALRPPKSMLRLHGALRRSLQQHLDAVQRAREALARGNLEVARNALGDWERSSRSLYEQLRRAVQESGYAQRWPGDYR